MGGCLVRVCLGGCPGWCIHGWAICGCLNALGSAQTGACMVGAFRGGGYVGVRVHGWVDALVGAGRVGVCLSWRRHGWERGLKDVLADGRQPDKAAGQRRRTGASPLRSVQAPGCRLRGRGRRGAGRCCGGGAGPRLGSERWGRAAAPAGRSGAEGCGAAAGSGLGPGCSRRGNMALRAV